MFKSTLFLGLLSGTFAGSLRASEDPTLSSNILKSFDTWAEKYEKLYASEQEKLERIKVWFHNHGTSFSKNLLLVREKEAIFCFFILRS